MIKIIFFLFIIYFTYLIFISAGAGEDQVCRIEENGKQVCIQTPKGANPEGKPLEVSLNDQCDDRHAQCEQFAHQGECHKNPGWMIVNCPHSCNSCHLRDPKVRCDKAFLNISEAGAFQIGELDQMFSNIENLYGERYGVTIHSTSPWIVTFDNFLNDEEVDALISTVSGNWERSTDTGQANEFGEVGRVLSSGRTSTNAWCRSECENHPKVRQVINKIVEVTTVPYENYESFQILQYDIGQKYNPHHDASERQYILPCGPRILTFFLYLSDVEEGGETAFPGLGISVKPKKGKALLWPSILSDNPSRIDHRTTHEARPVIKGKKYAANSWIHLHDFQHANLWGCTGTFDSL